MLAKDGAIHVYILPLAGMSPLVDSPFFLLLHSDWCGKQNIVFYI